MDGFSIREARFEQNSKGRPVLQEVYSFAERTGLAQIEAGIIDDLGPLSLFAPDRLLQCDEAFVAEQSGCIVGATTLAFNGVYEPHVPTLDGLYVLPHFQRLGIGFALLERAITRFVELGKIPVLCKVKSSGMMKLLDRLQRQCPPTRQQINAFIDLQR